MAHNGARPTGALTIVFTPASLVATLLILSDSHHVSSTEIPTAAPLGGPLAACPPTLMFIDAVTTCLVYAIRAIRAIAGTSTDSDLQLSQPKLPLRVAYGKNSKLA